MKKKYIFATIAFLLLLLPVVYAGPAPGSYTAGVTGYGFRENQDRYLSPLYFSELLNSVLFLQFDNPAMSTSTFEIGAGLLLSALYIGAYYQGYHYVQGLLGGNDSIDQNVAATLLVDGNNLITGKTETLTIDEEYSTNYLDDFRALVGLKIGEMHLGIYNQFRSYSNRTSALYNPNYTLPGGANWTTPGIGGINTTTIDTQEDAGGNVEWTDSTVYGLGESGTSYIRDDLIAGLSLALGSLQLKAYLDLYFSLYNNDDSAFVESFETRINSGFPAYTPGTALPDNTAEAIADCLSYNYAETLQGQSYIYLYPQLGALVEMPFQLMSLPATLSGGLNLGTSMYLYSNGYTDISGAAATVSGLVFSYTEVDYTTPGGVDTTVTDTRAIETREISDMNYFIGPSAGIVVTPDEKFRFSFAYQPEISFGRDTTNYAGTAREIITYEDGDGVNGNDPALDDPDDYVQTITKTYSGRSIQTDSFRLTNTVRTGVQIFLVPEKLRLNLGGTLSHTAINTDKTTVLTPGITTTQTTLSTNGATPVETDYDADTTPEDQSETIKNSGYTNISYSLGMTWFLSEAASVDFQLLPSAGNYDIWDLQNWQFEININIK